MVVEYSQERRACSRPSKDKSEVLRSPSNLIALYHPSVVFIPRQALQVLTSLYSIRDGCFGSRTRVPRASFIPLAMHRSTLSSVSQKTGLELPNLKRPQVIDTRKFSMIVYEFKRAKTHAEIYFAH